MSKSSKLRILRTFSANDWKQPESFPLQSFFNIQSSHQLQTFSSNAEKLRKSNQQLIEQH